MLEYTLKHRAEVGFQCKPAPGLLQIESIDFTKLETRDHEINYSALLGVLNNSQVIKVHLGEIPNEFWHRIIGALSRCRGIEVLVFRDLSSQFYFDQLGASFKNHMGLRELTLSGNKPNKSAATDAAIGFQRGSILWFHQYLSKLEVLILEDIVLFPQTVVEVISALDALKSFTWKVRPGAKSLKSKEKEAIFRICEWHPRLERANIHITYDPNSDYCFPNI